MSECPVCKVTLLTCKKLGDENYCKERLIELAKNHISEKEFIEKILSHFNEDQFLRELNSIVNKLKKE